MYACRASNVRDYSHGRRAGSIFVKSITFNNNFAIKRTEISDYKYNSRADKLKHTDRQKWLNATASTGAGPMLPCPHPITSRMSQSAVTSSVTGTWL